MNEAGPAPQPAHRPVGGTFKLGALGLALLGIAIICVARPKVIDHNVVTKELGATAPAAATTTTTTTTTAPAPTTTTAPVTATSTTAPVQAASTSVSSTSTTAPPVATTVTVPYKAPTIATTTEPGSFGASAEVVSASYPVTTSGGVVSVTGTWSGAVDLTLAVECGSTGPKSSTGPSGLSASATCPAGPATVDASEATTATVSYSLTIEYPSGGTS